METQGSAPAEGSRSISDQIRNVSGREVVLIAALFMATVLPGALTIFSFDRPTFLELDTFKVLILSASITLPVLMGNLGIAYFILGGLKNTFGFHSHLIVAALLSSMVFYPPLMILRLGFTESSSFGNFLLLLLGSEVVALIFEVSLAVWLHSRSA